MLDAPPVSIPLTENATDSGGNPWSFLFVVATGILWGTIGVVSKTILDNSSLDPVSITWLRSMIAGPVCVLAAWFTMGARLFSARRRDWGIMLSLGVVLVLYQWLYLTSIERIGVSAATLISLCGAPMIVALISTMALRQPMTRALLASLVGATLGVLLIVGTPDTSARGTALIGVLLSIGCAAGIGVHVVGMQSLATRVHPLQTLAVGFPIGAVLFTPLVMRSGVSLDLSLETWGWLFYLGAIPSSLAYLLYQRGLRDVPATIASIVTMLEPLIAAILAWWLFEERLGFWGWLGGFLLLASIGFLAISSVRPQRV